jgi:hypothetical protein
MLMDFEKEITHIATMIEPDIQLAPETIPITVGAVEEIDQDYGPESDNPLSFHNAPHSVGMIRRGVRMANILYPYIGPVHRRRFFDLVFVGGGVHDRWQNLGPIENERASAAYGVQMIEEADGILNTNIFKKRLVYAAEATAVRMKDDGKLVQVNLQRGAHDPIKFNAAFADINGIAMEGPKRMVEDAANLYDEITDEPTEEGLYDFLANQKAFLRGRLNDGQVKADIAYYFPDDAEAVYKDMRRAFRRNILSAFRLATMIDEDPGLRHPIGRIARNIGTRAILGSTIGKMIHRKVARDQ